MAKNVSTVNRRLRISRSYGAKTNDHERMNILFTYIEWEWLDIEQLIDTYFHHHHSYRSFDCHIQLDRYDVWNNVCIDDVQFEIV